jgi:uncharacterized protein (DUF885 family)
MANHASQAAGAESQLQQLFEQEWEYRLQEDPLLATWSGDARYNDRLPALSEADAHRRLRQAQAFLERLQQIERQALPEAEKLNYDIFSLVLQTGIAEHEFHLDLMPLSRYAGPHITLPDLIEVTPFGTEQDYENYLARLNAIPAYVEGHIDLMRAGMGSGYIPAADALRGLPDSLRSHLAADPSSSVFARPFERIPPQFPPTARERLKNASLSAVEKAVIPAFQSLLSFFETEYLPAARPGPGVSSLPDGRAYYEFCVRRYTTLDLSPQEVHSTGLQEVERIRAEMQVVIREAGFQGSFKEFSGFLRTDPQFYASSPEALLKEVALILKRMDGELPRLFKTLPRTPYGLRQTPEHIAPYSYSAYYFPAPGDRSGAGYYYVNTYDLKSRPLYEYEALSFHEAVPGHHLQLALQLELEDTPNFRRFGDMTAFIEGWALYAERLGLEAGFYRDPYSNFGRLIFEMWRACRLVVDTGIHYFDWTRQQAIDFMADNTALSPLNIENEVDRYISWPGQALAYKIGELKIRALREMAEARLGERFDRREFHEVLLSDGGIPLEVLEQKVKRWLEAQPG